MLRETFTKISHVNANALLATRREKERKREKRCAMWRVISRYTVRRKSFNEKTKEKLRAFARLVVRMCASYIATHFHTTMVCANREARHLRNSKLIALHNTSVLIRGYYAVAAYEQSQPP